MHWVSFRHAGPYPRFGSEMQWSGEEQDRRRHGIKYSRTDFLLGENSRGKKLARKVKCRRDRRRQKVQWSPTGFNHGFVT